MQSIPLANEKLGTIPFLGGVVTAQGSNTQPGSGNARTTYRVKPPNRDEFSRCLSTTPQQVHREQEQRKALGDKRPLVLLTRGARALAHLQVLLLSPKLFPGIVVDALLRLAFHSTARDDYEAYFCRALDLLDHGTGQLTYSKAYQIFEHLFATLLAANHLGKAEKARDCVTVMRLLAPQLKAATDDKTHPTITHGINFAMGLGALYARDYIAAADLFQAVYRVTSITGSRSTSPTAATLRPTARPWQLDLSVREYVALAYEATGDIFLHSAMIALRYHPDVSAFHESLRIATAYFRRALDAIGEEQAANGISPGYHADVKHRLGKLCAAIIPDRCQKLWEHHAAENLRQAKPPSGLGGGLGTQLPIAIVPRDIIDLAKRFLAEKQVETAIGEDRKVRCITWVGGLKEGGQQARTPNFPVVRFGCDAKQARKHYEFPYELVNEPKTTKFSLDDRGHIVLHDELSTTRWRIGYWHPFPYQDLVDFLRSKDIEMTDLLFPSRETFCPHGGSARGIRSIPDSLGTQVRTRKDTESYRFVLLKRAEKHTDHKEESTGASDKDSQEERATLAVYNKTLDRWDWWSIRYKKRLSAPASV